MDWRIDEYREGERNTIILFSACLRSIYGTFQDFLFAFVYILAFPYGLISGMLFTGTE